MELTVTPSRKRTIFLGRLINGFINILITKVGEESLRNIGSCEGKINYHELGRKIAIDPIFPAT